MDNIRLRPVLRSFFPKTPSWGLRCAATGRDFEKFPRPGKQFYRAGGTLRGILSTKGEAPTSRRSRSCGNKESKSRHRRKKSSSERTVKRGLQRRKGDINYIATEIKTATQIGRGKIRDTNQREERSFSKEENNARTRKPVTFYHLHRQRGNSKDVRHEIGRL